MIEESILQESCALLPKPSPLTTVIYADHWIVGRVEMGSNHEMQLVTRMLTQLLPKSSPLIVRLRLGKDKALCMARMNFTMSVHHQRDVFSCAKNCAKEDRAVVAASSPHRLLPFRDRPHVDTGGDIRNTEEGGEDISGGAGLAGHQVSYSAEL